MAQFDPGPSTERPKFPLAGRVMQPDTFQSIGATLVTALGATDGALDRAIRTIASLGDNDLAAEYHAEVAPAADAIAVLPAPSNDPELAGGLGIINEVLGNMEELAALLPNPFEVDEGPPIPPLPDPDTGKD